MRVLVVEDDDGFAGALIDALAPLGYQVTRCDRGADALLSHRSAELVLLDLGLPDIDGFLVLGRLREVSTVPVIVITARDDERSVVRALEECGADDYVVKGTGLRVLLARITAVTRRAPQGQVWVADVCVDRDAWKVQVAGAPVELTTTEFKVLAVLARHVGTVVSRKHIMLAVWRYADPSASRALDVHVANVRAKLGRPGLITTTYGYGYRFGEE